MGALLVAIVALVPVIGGCAAEEPAATPTPAPAPEIEPMKLTFASTHPAPGVSLKGDSDQLFMDLITERTDGAITFEAFWGGAMGAPAEHVEMCGAEVVDVFSGSELFVPGRLPVTAETEYVYPFGPSDPALVTEATRRFRAMWPQGYEDIAKLNMKLLACFSSPPYNIMSKTPINTLEDFEGKRIGLIGRFFGRWFEAAGAVPVVTTGFERYEMLRTGVLDMDTLPISQQLETKLHEQCKYSIDVGLNAACCWEIFINKDLWDSFSPELQQLWLDAGYDMEERHWKEMIPKWDDIRIKAWEEAGVQFSTLPATEKKKWVDRIDDIPAEWAVELTEAGYPGWEIARSWIDITEDLGFEWLREWAVEK